MGREIDSVIGGFMCRSGPSRNQERLIPCIPYDLVSIQRNSYYVYKLNEKRLQWDVYNKYESWKKGFLLWGFYLPFLREHHPPSLHPSYIDTRNVNRLIKTKIVHFYWIYTAAEMNRSTCFQGISALNLKQFWKIVWQKV